MGNSKLQTKKQITLSQRQQLLQQQQNIIFQNVDKLQISSENVFDICNMTVTQSIYQLNQGKLTSQQLLTALAYRTITLAKQLNLFTYLYYRKSLQIAIKCDQYRKLMKKKNITLKDMVGVTMKEKQENYLPSLYGIPISIKDVYHFQGRMATIGLISNSMKQHDESPLILCFRNAGMIPFVQTNVPQFGMAMETGNNLWGRAKNPWNIDRAVGGSSGGQAGMISLRCSILGVGSDIGGSVRIPAEHCGVFGLKPHSKRISNSYHASLSKSFQSFSKVIPNCIGPLARSAEDLALFMQIVTNKSYYQQKHDPYTPIIHFNPQPYLTPTPKKTRIGYLKHLQDLQPSPASQRALNTIIQLLQQDKNIELVQIQIPNQKQIIRQFIRQYLSCKGKNYRQMLNGQKEVKQYRAMFLTARLRAVGKFVVGGIARIIMPRTYFYYFQRSRIGGVMEYQGHVGEIDWIRGKWMEYWKLQKLDFVVAPGFGCQAFLHQQSQTLGLAAAYTYIWNVLDMAVGSLPVTRVRQNEQDYESRFGIS